jgi:GNAT superfamily N-acetyltransferase
MVDNNKTWIDLISDFVPLEEHVFKAWSGHENKFGEFGAPGFTKTTNQIRYERHFGHSNLVDGTVYLYRGEDGLLLCVYIYYIKDGQPKPFMLHVHPDYQRQGIATLVINESLKDFGTEFDYETQVRDLDLTAASANWGNKFIKNVYEQQNSTQE